MRTCSHTLLAAKEEIRDGRALHKCAKHTTCHTGTKWIAQSENANPTGQTQQSDSISQGSSLSHASRSKVIRVGQWNSSSTPVLTTNGLLSPIASISLQDLEDYYRFEWFWILLIMILLFNSAIAVHLVVRISNVFGALYKIARYAHFFLFSTGTHAFIFVLLKEFHHEIGRVIERYLYFFLTALETLLTDCTRSQHGFATHLRDSLLPRFCTLKRSIPSPM